MFARAGYACTLTVGVLVEMLHHRHHARQLAVTQVRSRGQTEAVGEDGFRNLPLILF